MENLSLHLIGEGVLSNKSGVSSVEGALTLSLGGGHGCDMETNMKRVLCLDEKKGYNITSYVIVLPRL